MQKVQSGVVLNFEKTGPDPPPIGDGESQLRIKNILFLRRSCFFCAALCSLMRFHRVFTAGGTKMLSSHFLKVQCVNVLYGDVA